MEEESDIRLNNPGKLLEQGDIYTFLVSELNNIYQNLTKRKAISQTKFIGAHPISLTKDNIKNLKEYSFVVCEKSDGVRYFLIILNNGKSYFHGRNTGNRYKVELQFFECNLGLENIYNEIDLNLNSDNMRKNLNIKYIFDGELVLDKINEEIKCRYLIFDTLIYDYQPIYAKKDYILRLKIGIRFVNTTTMNFNLLKINEKIDIELRVKDFFDAKDTRFVMDKYFLKLPHGQDGVIYTRSDFEYKPGATDSILKWKEPEQNTIDFLMVASNKYEKLDANNNRKYIELYVINRNENNDTDRVLFDIMIVNCEEFLNIQTKINELKNISETPVSGIIAECKFDTKKINHFLKDYFNKNNCNLEEVGKIMKKATIQGNINSEKYSKYFFEKISIYSQNNFVGNWKLYKLRMDKSEPNSLETAEKIMKGILDPVTKNDLLKFLN